MEISFSSSMSLIAVNSVHNINMKGCSRFFHIFFFVLLTTDRRKLAEVIQFNCSFFVLSSYVGAVTPFARVFLLPDHLKLIIESRYLVEADVSIKLQILFVDRVIHFLQFGVSGLEFFVLALCLPHKCFHCVILLLVFLFTSLARLSLCFRFQAVLLSVQLLLSFFALFALFVFLQVTKFATVQPSSLCRIHPLPSFVRRPSYFFLFFSRHLLCFSHFKFKTNLAEYIIAT